MADSTMKRLLLTTAGVPMEIVNVPFPTPKDDEFLIKIHSVGLNPLDQKIASVNLLQLPLPMVLGFEAAGTITSVGKLITKFKPGDEVFGTLNSFSAGQDYHAFNEYALSDDQNQWTKKPENVSFSDAAAAPIIFETAATAILKGLSLGNSALGKIDLGVKPPSSVLVLGGASGVGAGILEILHDVAPQTTVYATCSPHNSAFVKSLGAKETFDYNASDLVEQIKKASNGGVEVIMDAVGSARQQSDIFETLSAHGRKYVEVASGPPTEVPNTGIESTWIQANALLQGEFAEVAVDGLAKSMSEGRFRVPVPIEVRKGIEAIVPALSELSKNSARKLVVEF